MQQRRPGVTTISVDIGKSATRVRVRSAESVSELVGRGLDPREALADDLGDRIGAVVIDTLSQASPVDPVDVTVVAVGSTVYPETEQHRLLPPLRARWPYAQLVVCEDGVAAHAGALGGPGTVISARRVGVLRDGGVQGPRDVR